MRNSIYVFAAIAIAFTLGPSTAVQATSAKTSMAPETALFAGGCFWSMQSALEKAYGVISAVSGYAGRTIAKPTYENYAENGCVEAVRVTFDPSVLSYAELLDLYWHLIRLRPTRAEPSSIAGRSTGRSSTMRTRHSTRRPWPPKRLSKNRAYSACPS